MPKFLALRSKSTISTPGSKTERNQAYNLYSDDRFDSTVRQIVICLCVAWNRVTNSVHQGSLWEGAVSQRLTEGESPGFFDAVSYEALVIDQRSLLQSASRPAPSQREPLVLPAKLQFVAPAFTPVLSALTRRMYYTNLRGNSKWRILCFVQNWGTKC